MLDEEVIRKIVKEAVHETLSGLGFNMKDIHEAQADLLYLNNLRRSNEEIRSKIKTSLITVLVPTILYIAWETLKSKVNGK